MTGSMESRKSHMPEANKMARMLRSGRTTGDLAVRYGVNSNVIAQQLTANGWDAGTGEWVGGDKKDYRTGTPLSARGNGAGQTCHYVGGGDNPNVVPTTSRPFTERRRFTGFAWPAPAEGPPEPHYQRPQSLQDQAQQAGNNARRKLTALQEIEIAARYVVDLESMVQLARAFKVNQRTIRKHLESQGVVLRSRAEALQLRHDQRRAANKATLTAIASLTKDVA